MAGRRGVTRAFRIEPIAPAWRRGGPGPSVVHPCRRGEPRAAEALFERLVEVALAGLHEREDLADAEGLEVLGLAVLLEGRLVAVLLVHEEDARVLGIAVGDVVDVAGLGARRRDQLGDQLGDAVLLAVVAVKRATRTKAISALLLDGIGQGAEAFDLDRDLVSVLQQDLGGRGRPRRPTGCRWRSCRPAPG